MKEGIATARSIAVDTLGSDAELMYVVAFGDLQLDDPPLSSTFDLSNGKSNTWAYVYRSESQNRTTVVVVVKLLIIFQGFSLGDIPFQIPTLGSSLVTTGAYANSDTFVERLKTDSTYNKYRSDLPGALPDLISLGELIPGDSITLPGGFPLTEPTWSITWIGAGDSSMTCFVTAETGQVICRRRSVSISSVATNSSNIRGTANLIVQPNPATQMVRVTIDLPQGVRASDGIGLVLYDEAGRQVLNLTDRLAGNGSGVITFDAGNLPSGTYYIHAFGPDWTGTTGVVVGGR
jgi:hypothetical protein